MPRSSEGTAATNVLIRDEAEADIPSIFEINAFAFETDAEARLVNLMREAGAITLSLVAELADECIGHILFSPITVDGSAAVVGLAPMSVLPRFQRSGVGSALVEAGLERLRKSGVQGVVVLGHPEYYPRFGFSRASSFGLRTAFDVPDDVFMALELCPGGLKSASGLVEFHAAFNAL